MENGSLFERGLVGWSLEMFFFLIYLSVGKKFLSPCGKFIIFYRFYSVFFTKSLLVRFKWSFYKKKKIHLKIVELSVVYVNLVCFNMIIIKIFIL